ncbi:MAG: hypothetical protein H7320_00675 [Ferruginibacter sp.]|nr:hypothetical protein [Ferruginibacter sp.]
MRQLFLFFLLGVTMVACNDNKPEQDSTIMPLKSITPDTSHNTSTYQNLPQQMPANPTTGMPQTQTTMPQNITAGVTAAGMNPAHGKPGHKCEIAVGAPLNSAPARTATAPTTTNQTNTINQPTTTQPAISGAKTVTAKGMNPPHGEPGHRCDISVGAPLNSAPVAAKPAATNGAANITQMASPTQNSSIVPALQNTSISTSPKTSTAFTGKINPAHGQPGHDCKVAVGQPLP